MKRGRRFFNLTSLISKPGYESKVVWQALSRAGSNINLKGHIHEILIRDRFNANPLRFVDRKAAILVKSPTARAVDLVIMKGGRVLHRWQLKDSPASVAKLMGLLRKGRYSSVQVLGTRETVAQFEKLARGSSGLKVVRTSGVSSSYTTSIARRAGAKGAGTLVRALGTAARTGGLWGAIICGVLALFESLYRLWRRQITVRQACGHIGREASGGALAGAAAGVAGSAAGMGVAALVCVISVTGVLATASIVVIPLIPAVVVGAYVKGRWDRLWLRRPLS